jgi:hypothetical protein
MKLMRILRLEPLIEAQRHRHAVAMALPDLRTALENCGLARRLEAERARQ